MRFFTIGVLILILLIFSWDAFRFAQALPNFAQDRLPTYKVDLIAVVTGGQGRLKRAIDLLKDGKGEHLLISGVAPDADLNDILKKNNVMDLTEEWKEKIFLGTLSRTTSENVKEIKSLIQSHDFDSLLIVSSSYHMPRLYSLLEKELHRWPNKNVKVFYSRVESPNFTFNSWWKSPFGWYLFFSEYIKSLTIVFHLDSIL
jgi:uncharacterized SAM-binding protein YcdF (DUF218 family)